MRENFARTIGVIIFFGLFIGLLSLVGNPAKEETGIILVIALVSAGFAYFKISGNNV